MDYADVLDITSFASASVLADTSRLQLSQTAHVWISESPDSEPDTDNKPPHHQPAKIKLRRTQPSQGE